MELLIIKAGPKQGDLQEVVLQGGRKIAAYKKPILAVGDLVKYTPQGFGCASIELIKRGAK